MTTPIKSSPMTVQFTWKAASDPLSIHNPEATGQLQKVVNIKTRLMQKALKALEAQKKAPLAILYENHTLKIAIPEPTSTSPDYSIGRTFAEERYEYVRV
jgi:hypothetical protein